MTNTCVLFGGSGPNDWLLINILIIAATLVIVAIVYLIGNFLSSRAKGRITEITKIEITQAMISLIIIAVLMVCSLTICTTVSNIAQKQLGYSATPFQYAANYISGLAFGSNGITGETLLVNIYTYAIKYAIDAHVLTSLFNLVSNITSGIFKSFNEALESYGLFKTALLSKVITAPVNFVVGQDFGTFFSVLSNYLNGVFAPLVIIGIAFLFIQYLLVLSIQYVAFTVILPVAIALRSIAFSGAGGNLDLRHVANTFLAIAISLYIIYPLTIVFNGYMTTWMLSSSTNPSYAYLAPTLPSGYASIAPNTFFSSVSSATGINCVDSSGNPVSCSVACTATSTTSVVNPAPPPAPLYIEVTSCTTPSPCKNFNSTALTCDNPAAVGTNYWLSIVPTAPTLANYRAALLKTTGFGDFFGTLWTDITNIFPTLQKFVVDIALFYYQAIFLFFVDLTITIGFAMSLTHALNAGIEGASKFWGSV